MAEVGLRRIGIESTFCCQRRYGKKDMPAIQVCRHMIRNAVLCLAGLSALAAAQTPGQLTGDLLNVVQTARGLDNVAIKGEGPPPSTDDDGDGVTNNIDQCPNTPTGEAVDNQGCAESQKDDDSDGVANTTDQCPDTPAGETVDEAGCSASQLEPEDPEALVREVYEADVNPLIVSAQGGCTSSGCHGRSGAPGGLQLYGAGTANSTQLNYDSFVFYIDRSGADRLLSKISGVGHGGGTRYGSRTSEYATIEAWARSVEALP